MFKLNREASIVNFLSQSNKNWKFFRYTRANWFCTFYKILLRTKNANAMTTQSSVLLDISIFQQPERESEKERERGAAPVNTLGREYQGLQNGKYRSSTKMILASPSEFSPCLWNVSVDLNEKKNSRTIELDFRSAHLDKKKSRLVTLEI